MKKLLIVSFLLLMLGVPENSQAQLLDKVKKKTEDKFKREGEKRIDNKINQGVEKVYDEAEKQLEGNKENETEEKSKNANQNSEKMGEKSIDANDNKANESVTISSKYDFIPGEKVIFYDDFTSENIGDFPIQWNTTGSGEVVTTNLYDGRWFHMTNGRGITTLDEAVTLPDNYTIEFDVVPLKNAKSNNQSHFGFYILSTTKPKDLIYGLALPGEAGIHFSFEYNNYYNAYYNNGSPMVKGMETEPKLQADKKYRVSIWVQKERIRLYIGDSKLFDLPNAMSKNYKFNMIRFDGGTPMIGNVRIATGLPDMRSKLLTEGKLISYGIYFDVNKDIVKPESYPSIKEIASILADNPTVKINIVGHTDSDGDDKSNLELSKRRAIAVKEALVKNFSLDGSRIETDGKGEGEPVAPNDSGVNKALNRRVEFIKL